VTGHLSPEGGNVSDRLLMAEEVADKLAVPESWVREHTRAGLIPHTHWRKHRPPSKPITDAGRDDG
jgi:hypothetical protein